MNRIAILTLYNNNNNYGGMAQAYALCKYLNDNGFDTEIINYKKQKGFSGSFKDRLDAQVNSTGIKAIIQKGNYIVSWLFHKRAVALNRKKIKEYSNKLEIRKLKFQEFRDSIPHSKEYTAETIVDSLEKYDVFISGSDQIWKPGVIQDAYVLKFVPDNKKKISYATSIAISGIQKRAWFSRYLLENLSDYSAISVRECETAQELHHILKRNVSWVVDPTLLLDKSEWNRLVADRIVNEKYLFAYFLGKSEKQRKFVTEFARNNDLKIVNIPFAGGEYVEADQKFGDYRLFDIGIPEFFSLIKYAEIVFTDSFHAVCFSRVFEKNFYVMDRKVQSNGDKMNSRIESILQIMGLPDRLICEDTSNCLQDEIDYIQVEENLLPYIENSKQFLRESLLN